MQVSFHVNQITEDSDNVFMSNHDICKYPTSKHISCRYKNMGVVSYYNAFE